MTTQAEIEWKLALRRRYGTCDLQRLLAHELYGENADDPLRALYDNYARARKAS